MSVLASKARPLKRWMRWRDALLRRYGLALLCVCLGASLHAAHAETPSHDVDSNTSLDEVVVTGVRAGPRMWQVSKDGHVMWVLGVLDPLPKQLDWQSQEVNAALAESQAVLLDGLKVSPGAGLFAKLGLYLQFRRMIKNPDKRKLQQILPPDLYARFAALKQRYAKDDDGLDRLRPIIAAGKLYQAAIEHIGLSARGVITRAVEKQTKHDGLKPQTIKITVTNPRELLDSLSRVSVDAEIRCLAATLTRLESDLDVLRQRANAWALGDIATLRGLVDSDNRVACWDGITSVPRIKELTAMAEQEWMSAAETSLQRNQSTLALRSIRELLAADGVLAQFRAKGYQVVGP